jgi:hypothetical protein
MFTPGIANVSSCVPETPVWRLHNCLAKQQISTTPQVSSAEYQAFWPRLHHLNLRHLRNSITCKVPLLRMAQRIFIACRSNHDLIKVANLACKEQIGREYDPTADYLRYVGVFDVAQNRKCQVLVDCDSTVTSSPREVHLSCYNTSWDNGET